MGDYDALLLPQAQFYIVVALFIAVISILTTHIRTRIEGALLPNKPVNFAYLLLVLGVSPQLIHLVCLLLQLNDFNQLQGLDKFGFIAQFIALVMVSILIYAWYFYIAIHKEAESGRAAIPQNEP
ncbi:MAG: hypothetical protein OXG05_14280 [Gammaproteobacteria bacterium]|nr:hypothetical protein [Gammaproteobacteria bacterium]